MSARLEHGASRRVTIEVDPADVDWHELHGLLTSSYRYMEGRIDPPSSLLMMTADDLARKAIVERLITASVDDRLSGCVFCRPEGRWLYVGKMAVAIGVQRSGVGRSLIDAARRVAARDGLDGLELETRIELTENHRAFGRLGFVIVAEQSHPGYTAVTSIRMRSSATSPRAHAAGL